MSALMDHIRRALGLPPPEPPQMTVEQSRVNDRLRRIELRQKAIDVGVDVYRVERREHPR